MAEKNSSITIDVRLNLEGDWRRADFILLCVQNGVDSTEDAYLQWRAVGERLTGRPCFETTMKRATAALESLSLSMAGLGHHFSNIIKAQRQHDDAKHNTVHQGAARSVAQ